ncbi:hypothetical protein LUW74_32605 [Actinomadura madurae]|uniref:hypothetical protein n=1 Tax=Actinomadura madurae TaxID=1993 RepID=UPI00202742BD|nr:hypothetical protein [Actinomadura madurae]URN07632.1 hypothetical protein LUW74_32605 [Actinomadura madurae]
MFDPRVLRPTPKARLSILGRMLIGRLVPALLIAVLLGMAFWCGAVAGTVRDGARLITPDVSSTASQYLAEMTPFALTAALLLTAFRWGIGWLLPVIAGAAFLLGFVRSDLPSPGGVARLPQAIQDAISGFFAWGNGHPSLKLVWLSILGLVLARVSIEALGQRAPLLRWMTSTRSRAWWFTPSFKEEGRRAFGGVTSLRIVVAVPLVLTVQALLVMGASRHPCGDRRVPGHRSTCPRRVGVQVRRLHARPCGHYHRRHVWA